MTRKRSVKKKPVVKSKREKEVKDIKEKTFKIKNKKKILIPITLVVIFFLVLFFNSYFNYNSGLAHNEDGDTLGTRFFLSGPDPYYNMRLCEQTLETGEYPFVEWEDGDPLLNYPVGVYAGARPPLFNMIAVGCTNVISGVTGMAQMDALGWSMLWLPAIYGALLIFPVYGMGKELFNKKVGIISALLIPLIPIHIGAGHGSSFALFDHDSFLLLLFACLFYFVIKSYKSEDKKFIFYACLAGVFIGAIKLTWAVSHTIFIMLVVYLIVQFFFDIFKKNITFKTPILFSIMFGVGFLISAPYIWASRNPELGTATVFLREFLLIALILSITLYCVYYLLKKFNLPWVISFPGFCVAIAIGLFYLKMVNQNSDLCFGIGIIQDISAVIYGSGIYGTQTALTIGEAATYGISQTVMSFGPALYWVGLCGFIMVLYKTFKDNFKPEFLFIITIFVIQFWMTTSAGRFINDMVPLMVVFAGFIIWLVIKKIDYKSMIRATKSVSGFKKIKTVKPTHMFGIVFVSCMILLPNAFLSMDAAVPGTMKEEIFGEDYVGSYGLSLEQQYYWADACYWLSQQDTNISEDGDKPGVLTWWDYGFYLASMSKHPTVADNYQEGIECAGNFHTAQSEEEATSVLIIRLVEGVKTPKRYAIGKIPQEVKDVFRKYLGNESVNLSNIIEDPTKHAPLYDTFISPEWGNDFLKVDYFNAMYHDATDILMTLPDAELTKLHHEIMEVTGYQIRYYGIEQRDMRVIYGVFPFLSDKSTHGYVTMEDDWFKTIFVDKNTGMIYTKDELDLKTEAERQGMDITTSSERKEPYFNSIAYRVFFGIRDEVKDRLPDNRVPCYLMKHWKPVYVSPYITLAKYYEGVKITGVVTVGDILYDGTMVYVMDEQGIPHDYTVVRNGQFEVIGLEGITYLHLYMEQNFLAEVFVGDISEEEATWQVESNYTTNFSIDFADVNVTVSGLPGDAILNITGLFYTDYKISHNISNGVFTFENFPPARYEFSIVNSTGVIIDKKEIYLKPGHNALDIILGES